MSWEAAPRRRGLVPSAVVVLLLVAVGAALAVGANVGADPDDRFAVDSDVDAPPGAGEDGEDGEVLADEAAGTSADDGSEAAEPVEEEPLAGAGDAREPADTLPPGDGLTLPGETGLELFAQSHSGEVARVDLDTGEMTRVRMGRSDTGRMLVVGDTLLREQDGIILAADADLASEARRVAAGYEIFPATRDDEVWVAHTSPERVESPEATRARIDGSGTVASYQLTMADVIGAHPDGLVIEQHGHISVHDPEAGQGRRIASGRPVGYADGRVAWVDCAPDLTCDLVVSSTDGAEEARARLPQEAQSPWFQGVLSPTGEYVVAPVYHSPGLEPTTLVISTRDGATIELAATGGGPQAVAWAPDGSWAFIGVPNEGVLAWRPADGEQRLLRLGLDHLVAGVAVR